MDLEMDLDLKLVQIFGYKLRTWSKYLDV